MLWYNNPMVFYGINNQEIEIKIINYEFPPTSFGYNNVEHDGFDDWINVKVSIKSDFGNYEHTSSIFLLYELENLIYWLKKLSKNKPSKNESVTTIEDYFLFELINKYKDKEKRIKIKFKEKEGSYIEILASNKILRKYYKELLSELNFLHKTYKSIRKLYKILNKEIKNKKNDKIIVENQTVKIKENFKKGYKDEKGYKIIYTKNFIKDLNLIKKNKNDLEEINTQIEDIKLFPFKYRSKWDNFFMTYGISYKIIEKYIIFFVSWRYEIIRFIRLIENNKYYNNYLVYDFRDLSFEED